MLKKFLIVFSVLMTAACVCACRNSEKSTAVSTPPTISAPTLTQENNSAVSDSIESAETTVNEEFPEPDLFLNPLTGMETSENLTNIRPIAVMINNLKQALPQIGISEADVIYETLEEGGITRLLCVYNNYADIPEIGSVRSARDYYIDLADAHDAIFVHAGASTYATTALSQRKTNNLDGIYLPQFYRSTERQKIMRKEHTLMISGNGICQAIEYKGYRTESQSQSPLIFDKEYATGNTSANHIEFSFSIGYVSNPYVTAFFDYNQETGEYMKGEFGQAHIDGDDEQQLSFKNVITLSCPMNRIQDDPLGCIQVHFIGEGRGSYSVDGTSREIIWKKPTRSAAYALFESDGITPLLTAPGKSYIAIVPTGTEITLT